MVEDIRTLRQKEFAEQWLRSDRHNILYLCPRFGKCFVTITILEHLPQNCTVLLAYPDIKIKQSWIDDFEKRNYTNPNITFTTHMSLKKYKDKIFDLVVIDEIHLLSEAQIEVCKELFKENKEVLGLTGTLSSSSKYTLWHELKLPILATYSIEQAIQEGIITDYEITVVKVPLDVNIKTKGKSEKQRFDGLTWRINKLENEGKDTMFLRFARMRVIQNSTAKLNKTKEILSKYSDERILVFTGVTKIADSLGIPSYHSKSIEKNVFKEFSKGIGNHLAVCKIGNTGITYVPLNRVIINYFDSNSENFSQRVNRCLSLEYDNPDKKGHIYIICSTEDVELRWLMKAISMFDKTKIKYI